MPEAQAEAFDAVHFAAARIATEIDLMMAALPADTEPTELAANLMDDVASMSEYPQFVAVFTEALIARRALTELGVKI